MKSPLICLMGPTASGKTPLAVEIVKRFPCEIISVDSAMIYRDMDIGTAKPDASILKIAPHRLINIVDPKEMYSAGQFQKEAWYEIKKIIAQGKIPLLVGGTMMYFHILQQGLSALPKQNESIRKLLQSRAEEVGWPALHADLTKIDSDASKKIHPHDSQRIQRALEVYQLTGQTMTMLQREKTTCLADEEIYNLALFPKNRLKLHERIAKRFYQMLELGFIDEVKKLYERGDLSPRLPSMKAVGYREVWAYLDSQWSEEAMHDQAIAKTRQLAKRQLTWLRSFPNCIYFDNDAVDFFDKVMESVEKIVNSHKI